MANKRQLVVDLKTGKSRPFNPRLPMLTSASEPWENVVLQQYGPGPVELLNIASPAHVILLQLKHTAMRETKCGWESARIVRFQPGQSSILPAMLPYSVRSPDTGEFIVLTMEPSFLLCAAHPLVDPDHFELVPRFGHEDLLLRAGLLALKAEAEAGSPGGRLYAESLAAALAVHLVRHYSATKPVERLNGGGLAPHALRRAMDFMRAHLAEDLSLDALAEAVKMSRFHFARLFKKSTGLAPHQYLIRCRIERAKELLLVDHASIAEVAQQVGFCDQSHLAVYFKRTYGVTPKAFAQRMAPRKTLV